MITHDYVYDGPGPADDSGSRACEPLLDPGETAPPGRERDRALGVPSREEATRLRTRFGVVLRAERGHLTQQALADRAKLHKATIVRLENGGQRPAAASVWKICRALRGDLRSRTALFERLRVCAGDSWRDYGKRPHAARERVRLAMMIDGDGSLPASDADSLGVQVVAELSALANRGGRGG